MVAAYSKAQLGKDPKGLKVAIIHEDGPYGTDVAKGTIEGAAEAGFQVVVNEGYSASARICPRSSPSSSAVSQT